MKSPLPAIPISATRAALFRLGQAWAAVPDPRLQATLVECSHEAGHLRVEATLWDEDIANTAREHNERTWETGDVFEIFLRREDAAGYAEVHVTPDNVRLHLQFADFTQHQRIGSIAEVAADPLAIESRVERFAGGWRVFVSIPCVAHAGEFLRVSCCRYDAAPHWPSPVLSSSSPHPVCKFHRPEEWPRLVILAE